MKTKDFNELISGLDFIDTWGWNWDYDHRKGHFYSYVSNQEKEIQTEKYAITLFIELFERDYEEDINTMEFEIIDVYSTMDLQPRTLNNQQLHKLHNEIENLIR